MELLQRLKKRYAVIATVKQHYFNALLRKNINGAVNEYEPKQAGAELSVPEAPKPEMIIKDIAMSRVLCLTVFYRLRSGATCGILETLGLTFRFVDINHQRDNARRLSIQAAGNKPGHDYTLTIKHKSRAVPIFILVSHNGLW